MQALLERPESSLCDEPYFADRDLLNGYASLGATSLGRKAIGVAHFRRDEPNLGVTIPNIRRELFLASICLRPLSADTIWCDGRAMTHAPVKAGGLVILDHRHAWNSRSREPFEMIHLYLPIQNFHALADELGTSRLETLHLPVTSSCFDPVMYHLAISLLPALRNSAQASQLFLDYVSEAACVHLAGLYGGMSLNSSKWRGGLAPWQERRVKEMLLGDLRVEPSLDDLAAACGLSTRHFTRAFKSITGAAPHRWLLRKKVERAKELLWKSNEGIASIAVRCGFADQSHLTRVFRHHVGATPAEWRRQTRT
jgi:AraC family transcriptional regulator